MCRRWAAPRDPIPVVVAEGARRVAVRANEDDELRIATILARGFHEDRRHRREKYGRR